MAHHHNDVARQPPWTTKQTNEEFGRKSRPEVKAGGSLIELQLPFAPSGILFFSSFFLQEQPKIDRILRRGDAVSSTHSKTQQGPCCVSVVPWFKCSRSAEAMFQGVKHVWIWRKSRPRHCPVAVSTRQKKRRFHKEIIHDWEFVAVPQVASR